MNLINPSTEEKLINSTNDNNYVEVIGNIKETFKKDHEFNGEVFYQSVIEVKRLSGYIDKIVVICSEYLVTQNDIGYMRIIGQFRSYNFKDSNGKIHLRLFLFAKYVEKVENIEDKNSILLTGIICKPVTFRMTPKGKVLTDVLLAVNRAYGKSDYIPCIAWGVNAKHISELNVGDEITIHGRIQSRDYSKETIINTAYEVSIISIE